MATKSCISMRTSRGTVPLTLALLLVSLLLATVIHADASDDHDHHSVSGDSDHHDDDHDHDHHGSGSNHTSDDHHDDDDDHDHDHDHDDSHHSDDHHDDHDDHHDDDHSDGHHDDHDHHGHHGHHDDHADDVGAVNALKGMSLGVIGAVGIIVDVLVVAFPQLRTRPKLISLLSSFAAGIFIVIGLAHLLAEGVDIITANTDHDINERWRPAYMMCIAGYYAMVLLQRGVLRLDEKLVKDCMHYGTNERPTETREILVVTSSAEGSVEGQANSEAGAEGDKDGASKTDDDASADEKQVVEPYAAGGDSVLKSPASIEDGKGDSSSDNDDDEKKNKNKAIHDCDSDPVMQRKHQLNLIILFIMFYIHGITEGIVLGLQTTKSGVLVVFIAIVAHHWVADLLFTFATGRVHALSTFARLAISITLSLNASVGIAIGWVLSETIPSLATGYIVAFCSGSFIMIAMTEIIAEEMPIGKRNVPQLVASALGVVIMYGTLAGMYSPEAHNH